jgi:hypothetical protein
MAQSAAGLAVKYFVGDLVGGIVLFPVWWYTRGLDLMVAWTRGAFASANRTLGFGIWVKNLFVPMYGETELSGRLVSFSIRLFMIVARGIGVLAWGLLACLALAGYAVALPLAVIGIFFNATRIFLG